MRQKHLTTRLIIIFIIVTPNCLAYGKISQQPNILFLFADDQRFDTLAAWGNPEMKTPNMDRLAHQGVSFTHAHIMGSTSGAVCMPSRAMLMTGRMLFHLQDSGWQIPPEHITLPEVFKKAGYATFGTGKWHNGPSAYARSFTHGGKIFFGGMSDHLRVPVFDFDPTGKYEKKHRYIAQKFSSILFSDEAIEFLSNYKDDRPFFMYVSYTAPHDPRMAPQPYRDLYPPDKIELPENFLPQHPFDNGELEIRDEKLAPIPRTPEIVREHIAGYYAMITHLDHQIGRVLQALDQTGRAENTIIVFSADNGLAVGQHGLLGKQNLYQHSLRVPLIITGPGIAKGQTCKALCYLHDLYPTLCQLAGISIPPSVESKSLVPCLKDQNATIRNDLFFAYKTMQRSIRDHRWKLIKYHVKGKQTTQLFDLKNDPWEIHNLADDPKQQVRLQQLTTLLNEKMKAAHDPCDLNKPNWKIGVTPNRTAP